MRAGGNIRPTPARNLYHRGLESILYYHGWQQKWFRCIETDMPRIPDDYLECSVYLYPSIKSARKGEQVGGSGVLIAIPSEAHSDFSYIYAVTCSHVVTGGARVIRLNTRQGDVDFLNFKRRQWTHHPSDDLAAVHIGGLDREHFRFKVFQASRFINQGIIHRFDIGPGDEVFMVGRFITPHNQQRNSPSVRFGNISIIEPESIFNEDTGANQESIAVEMRSIPGYSGAPVFVYTPFDEHHHPWSARRAILKKGNREVPMSQIMPGGPWLLGIGWGFQSGYEKVLKSDGRTPVPENELVLSNSGMMYTIPAWRVLEFLHSEKFLGQRRSSDKLFSEVQNQPPVTSGAN